MSKATTISIDHSHVVLIECLPVDERSIQLSDSIQDIINASSHNNTTQYIGRSAGSRDDLINCLEAVCKGLEECSSPQGVILRLEAHGADFESEFDKVGIAVGDNREPALWSDLQPYFSRLYRASAGRLTLNISAC